MIRRQLRASRSLFNDAILRVAFELRLTVVDLRLICIQPSDYANSIEPSGKRRRQDRARHRECTCIPQ